MTAKGLALLAVIDHLDLTVPESPDDEPGELDLRGLIIPTPERDGPPFWKTREELAAGKLLIKRIEQDIANEANGPSR